MLKHVIQPRNSDICGHCSIAMVAEISLEEAKLYVGTGNRAATWGQIFNVLYKKVGARVVSQGNIDNRRRRFLRDTVATGRGILRIEVPGRRLGHAVAYKDGIIYDPAGKVYATFDAFIADYRARGKRWRVSHIMTVELPVTREWKVGNGNG